MNYPLGKNAYICKKQGRLLNFSQVPWKSEAFPRVDLTDKVASADLGLPLGFAELHAYKAAGARKVFAIDDDISRPVAWKHKDPRWSIWNLDSQCPHFLEEDSLLGEKGGQLVYA